MNKNYKINKDKNIGTVIFVVEGGSNYTGGTELRLIKTIFSDILGYEVNVLKRGSEEFVCYGENKLSRVFALNLPKNQLTQLNENELDKLFIRIKDELKVKPEDCPIFFIYDRDYLSYHANELRTNYVQKYTDPYSNNMGNQGQLLLSYPSVESYLLSCFKSNVFEDKYFLGKDIKPAVEDAGITVESINKEEHIINAVKEMDNGLSSFGIDSYDIDHLDTTFLSVYDFQQELCKKEKLFSVFSLISMAFLELGIIYTDE